MTRPLGQGKQQERAGGYMLAQRVLDDSARWDHVYSELMDAHIKYLHEDSELVCGPSRLKHDEWTNSRQKWEMASQNHHL